jgi:alpha-1,2-mannosyltransferase
VQKLFVFVIVPLYLSVRISIAPIMPIMDCDEVYNYWEPLHFMLFGSGHQTWEYHSDYALRTYAYLVPLEWWARSVYPPLWASLSSWMVSSNTALDPKAQLFVLLRQTIAGMTAIAELWWLYALLQYYLIMRPSSTVVPLATAVGLLTCTGMHHAAGALLPSATWMAVWCACAACLLQHYHTLFLLLAVTGTLATGWPFGCVCVVPMALRVLYQECCIRRRAVAFFVTIAAVTALVQGIVMAIDYHHYGALTLPTVNIFSYNAGGNGDELYGVEPASYYVKNLLLNGHVVFLLGMAALPVYFATPAWTTGTATKSSPPEGEEPPPKFDWSMGSILLSLPVWLLITVPRPHKEERFLFPIYPVLVLGAALTVDALCTRGLAWVRRRRVPSASKAAPGPWHVILQVLFWMPVMLLSFSRSMALQRYYSAPLDVYMALATVEPTPSPQLVCTCGEWYRYPSSFLLPEAVVSIPVGFLPSSFTGQLPQPFTKYGSKLESRTLLQPFNDRNVEQPERYVTDVTECGWLVDLGDSPDCMAQFPSETTVFKPILSVPFLDAAQTATLHRTLYLPFLHERARHRGTVVYHDYTLYQVGHRER